MRRLLITTGDPDGVGSEVTAKALKAIGPRKGYQFVIFRSRLCPPNHLRMLDSRFSRLEISNESLLPRSGDAQTLIEIVSDEAPARWVEAAATLCLKKKAAGLVTGPMSKTGIRDAGLSDHGHTEILSRVTKRKFVYMAFHGRKFNVVLLTDHIPLMRVRRELTSRRIAEGLRAAMTLRRLVGSKQPVALLGLNPHAGEEGMLGDDASMFSGVLRSKLVRGPLVPDVAFLPENWKRFSVFVCPYHDQGLIPFKLVHGFDEGVHLTLGLPFVRTSVDHGTAKDIFGLNRARAGSMIEAIELAMKLA